MDGSALEEKSSLKMLGLTLSLRNWIEALTLSQLLTLICSMKFLSPGVALYLCKSTMQPCMEY